MRQYLSAIEFPATKIEVIACAEAAGAPQPLIERMQALGLERFENAEAVIAAVAEPS